MRPQTSALVLAALLLVVASDPLPGDDTVINTPVMASRLRGEWELQPADKGEYRQALHLGGSVEGTWQQGPETLPVTIAWFIEGAELRISHYYEPAGAFNYRVKDLRFAYTVDADTLTLTRDGTTTTWKRVKPPADARP